MKRLLSATAPRPSSLRGALLGTLRGTLLGVVVVGTVVTAGSACNSDRQKNTGQASANVGADGGVLIAQGGGGSDPTDSPKGPNDGLKDEPRDAGAPDAGALLVDAGGGAVPTVTEQVDAGHMGDQKAGTKTVMGGGSGSDALKDNLHTTVWNRVLVKVKTRDMPPTSLEEMVEKATGQKIEKVRKTAGTFWLLQFSPTTPARKQPQQQQLIDQLKKTGSFDIVEGDQIMTLK